MAYERLSDMVFEKIRSEILSGELEKGSLHSIYELADRFEVSRTPVREAAVRLADTGIVTIERNRGIRVRGFSATEIQEIYAIRLMLEVSAASRAATVCDPAEIEALDDLLREMHDAVLRDDAASFWQSDYALHDRILSAYGNQRLNEYVRGLRNHTRNMGAITLQHTRTLLDVGLEHEPIVEAIRRGDPSGAADAMATHLVETGALLIALASGESTAVVSTDWAEPYLAQLTVPASPPGDG